MERKRYIAPVVEVMNLPELCETITGSVYKGTGNPTNQAEGDLVGQIGWGGSNVEDDESDARQYHFDLWGDDAW